MMAIKRGSSQAPPDAVEPDVRTSGGNRCPVKHCTGVLRGETDGIGRVAYSCDDCERRAKLEHEARFGTYLDHLRAQRREREAKQYEAALAANEVERCCEICGDPLQPPNTRVCEKTDCKRQWKADYQRRRFGRPLKPDTAAPEDALDLFRNFP